MLLSGIMQPFILLIDSLARKNNYFVRMDQAVPLVFAEGIGAYTGTILLLTKTTQKHPSI